MKHSFEIDFVIIVSSFWLKFPESQTNEAVNFNEKFELSLPENLPHTVRNSLVDTGRGLVLVTLDYDSLLDTSYLDTRITANYTVNLALRMILLFVISFGGILDGLLRDRFADC